MKTTLLVATGIFLLSGIAAAAAPAGGDDHAAHHPSANATKEDAAKADQQMSVMRDMHTKMLAAKTPEERTALMADHMKAMQSGMAMTGSMDQQKDMRGTKAMGGKHDAMTRRMGMVEMMMQMMMDREVMKPPAAK